MLVLLDNSSVLCNKLFLGEIHLFTTNIESLLTISSFLCCICRHPGLHRADTPHVWLYTVCFGISSWNFAYDIVLLYYRSSSNVMNFRQFLWELCPFWNLEFWKYKVFRTFLLHALTYWAEILHLTLFYCTTDQVRVSSIFVGVMPLLEIRILEIVFRTFLLHALTYRAEILHLTLFYCTTDQVRVSSIFVGVLPLLEIRILEIVFCIFLLHTLTYRAEILHMTLFYCTADQVSVSSISVNFCGSYARFGT